MIEPEIAFADLGANMELAEAMVKYIIKYVMDNCPEEMEFFNSFIEKGLFDKIKTMYLTMILVELLIQKQ